MMVVLNVVMSYAAWFAVALLAARGDYALAVLPSVAAVALHLALVAQQRRRTELMVSLAALPLGLAVESVHMAAGATQYAGGAATGGLPPAFMIGLWAAFATLVNTSLGWLKDRLGLAAVFGALASGPSYFAGAKLGALGLGEPVWQSLAMIGMVWAVAFPVLILIAKRLDR